MKNGSEITVLITGVGDTVGHALIKAARGSRVPCRVLGADADARSAGLHLVDDAFVLPHCREVETYLAELRKVCVENEVQLILPGSEIELELLSNHAQRLREETGAIVVASPPAVLSVALDKLETCRFLERAGLNFPQFAPLDASEVVERLIAEAGFPLIAKPRRGTGARGQTMIESPGDIERLRENSAGMVLQEFLNAAEEEYSVEIYTLKNGRQIGAICYQRLHMVAGDTYKAWVGSNAEAEREARAVAAALGPMGPCNVQLRMTERGPVTFEINPRFSGGVSIRAHFGFNEIEMAIRDLVLNESVPEPEVRSGHALRFWEEIYLEETSRSGTPSRSDPPPESHDFGTRKRSATEVAS